MCHQNVLKFLRYFVFNSHCCVLFTVKASVVDPPPKRDFLDVERLRLLSSAHTRPVSTTRPRPNTNTTDSTLSSVSEEPGINTPWIHVDKTLERQKQLVHGNFFQSGDGFDVFCDGARMLPDAVTLTKVTIAALHCDRSQIVVDNNSQYAALSSTAQCPSFDLVNTYTSVFAKIITLF